MLRSLRADQRRLPVGWVWYLEADASFRRFGVEEVLAMMRQMLRNIHVGWPGWRHEGSQVSWHYNIRFALEGSHAVVFCRNGLQQFWEATCATARYRHLDFMLSQRLAGRFWFPNVPFVFTTTHKSVIYGKGERRTRRGNAYRGRGAAVKKIALILKFSMVV